MTVDRAHVLATPGMDTHSSYVALSRHRDGMDLHYGRDDFADRDRLTRTLSRDRAKDMASDYERLDPAQSYAEQRGITFRAPVAEIVRNEAPSLARETAEDREMMLRQARTDALVRHARAVDAIFEAQDAGTKVSPTLRRELTDARRAFEEVLPYGWRDAEAAYVKDPDLAREAGAGQVSRAIRALDRETAARIALNNRADRFVERWQKLDWTSEQQYQEGDMSGYKATRSAMGDMARSLERDPQLESILANRKADLGIHDESGCSLGRELAFNHCIDYELGRGLGL